MLNDAAGTRRGGRSSSPTRRCGIRGAAAELVTLPEDATPDEIERAVAKHGFSRYVIVDADGEPAGYVHLKDVLEPRGTGRRDRRRAPIPPKRIHAAWSRCSRPPTSRTRSRSMRRAGRHLAQVRDETGDTTAVLFLEDIIEELVGEVQDATRRRAERR